MIFIRADANASIASGHVMRCISIARELIKQGKEVTFLTAEQETSNLIRGKGFLCKCLFSDYRQLEGEIPQLCSILKEEQVEGILVDSYFVTSNYLERLKQITNVIYIDDRNEFIYPVDMLIQYSNPAQLNEYQKRYEKTETKLLLGSQYIPLREEFYNVKPEIKEVTDILITTGASDSYNFCYSFLSFLKEQYPIMMEGLKFHIIIGEYHTYLAELKKLASNTILLYEKVSKMSDHIKQADLVISAGGTTLYEICACGTPAISFTFADNQIEGAKYLHKENLIFYCGDIRGNQIEKRELFQHMFQKINELAQDEKKRRDISKQMQMYVNGEGAKTIAFEIKNLVRKRKGR